MTTEYIKPDWTGKTIAILGGGPSMSQTVADALKQYDMRVVVNDAHVLAPDADMLVALDGAWPEGYGTFAGMRVTGVHDGHEAAMYVGPMYERITLAPGHTVEVRNSGLAAIRLAADAGAARIILAGFEPHTGAHWFDSTTEAEAPYKGHLIEGLAALRAELVAQVPAVLVEDYVAPTQVAPKKKWSSTPIPASE